MNSLGKWFHGLRIKMLFLVAIPSLIIGVLVYLTASYMKEIAKSADQVTQVRVPSIKGLETIGDSRLRMRISFFDALNDTNHIPVEEVRKRVTKILAEYHEGWKIYEPLEQTPEEAKEWQAFVPVAKVWEENALKTLSLIEANKRDEARTVFSGPLRQAFLESLSILEKILEINYDVIELEKNKLHNDIENAGKLGLMFGSLGALATIVFGLFLTFSLAGTISSVTDRISEAGTQVSSASEQLSSASQQLSAGATESASSLEETVSSLEELSSMVKLNADNAKEASSLSLSSRKSAEDGESEIRNLIGAMTDISKSSKKIEEIINVIDDIAFQTNLLALNAAVEAARAGEQGKGFAVVAEAVRNLAQRSASAAKDITVLIKESVEQISTGSKIADQSGAVLKNIVNSVKKVSDLNNEIASASSEQSKGISQISKAMNELDQSTQRNASSAEETAASSEEMSAQASELQSLVGELEAIIVGAIQAHQNQARTNTDYRARTVQKHSPRLKSIPGGKKAHNSFNTKASQNAVDASQAIPFDDDESSTGGKIGNTVGF
jgi:methyl-accepting chemotaxis protein